MDDAQALTNIIQTVLADKAIDCNPLVIAAMESSIREQFQGCQLYITKSPTKIPERVKHIRQDYRTMMRDLCHKHQCSEAYLRQCVRNKPATGNTPSDNLDLFSER